MTRTVRTACSLGAVSLAALLWQSAQPRDGGCDASRGGCECR